MKRSKFILGARTPAGTGMGWGEGGGAMDGMVGHWVIRMRREGRGRLLVYSQKGWEGKQVEGWERERERRKSKGEREVVLEMI